MLAEHGNISVGIDLGRDYSQIAFCSKSDRAPLMVMQSEEEKEENDYLIRTPVDLFSLWSNGKMPEAWKYCISF